MKATVPKPRNRPAIPEARRTLKMARSAHAYVRGNTVEYYEWLESLERGALPEGPPIWCGDCHIGNLGLEASTKGQGEIEISRSRSDSNRKSSPRSHPVGLSLATAIRGSDLPGVTTAQMLEKMIDGYKGALSEGSRSGKSTSGSARPIEFVLKQALKRKWRYPAEERIEDVKPTIPLGEQFLGTVEGAFKRLNTARTARAYKAQQSLQMVFGHASDQRA